MKPLDHVPLFAPVAIATYLIGMLVASGSVERPTPMPCGTITLGELRRLQYPDETPVVVANWSGDGNYRSVGHPKIVVAAPDDLSLNWFVSEDSRGNGRISQQILFLENR